MPLPWLGVNGMAGDATCPAIDGLYFPDGTFIALSDGPDGTVAASSREPVAHDTVVAGLASLHIQFRSPAGEHVLVGGGGAWEGEGFLACLSIDGDLEWLLYVEDGEAFSEATVEKGIVTASAAEYPVRNVVRLPLHAPQWVQMTRTMIRSDGHQT